MAHAPALSRFVEDVRTIAPPRGQSFDLELLPDGRTRLFFRVLEGESTANTWVAGPRMRAVLKRKSGVVQTIAIRLKPGSSMVLLGVPTSELTDRVVPLEDMWGRVAATFSDELLGGTSADDVMGGIARAFRLRTPHETASSQLAQCAVRMFESGDLRVEKVAERLGVTGRHLRRAFTDHVGVGPKEFARTVRLQRVVALASTSLDWARIAADAGYYDQAHLIAEFRKLVGITPSAYVRRTRVQDPAIGATRVMGDQAQV